MTENVSKNYLFVSASDTTQHWTTTKYKSTTYSKATLIGKTVTFFYLPIAYSKYFRTSNLYHNDHDRIYFKLFFDAT